MATTNPTKSADAIDNEISALYKAIELKRQKITTPDANSALDERLKDVRTLDDLWQMMKDDQEHLFEENRRRFEGDVYRLGEQIKRVHDHK